MNESSIKIFASPSTWIESKAIDQLKAVSALKGVEYAAGMPDLHPGRGIPVGAVTITRGIIYPHIIGGDIGCGISLYDTDTAVRNFKMDKAAKKLEAALEPDAGYSKHDASPDGEMVIPVQGTIGGGNHFAEFQKIESIIDENLFAETGLQRDRIFLLVHSGSRFLGQQIYSYFIRTHQAQHGIEDGSALFESYMAYHEQAVEWAKENRNTVAEKLFRICGISGSTYPAAESVHNAVERREHESGIIYIHRKGAAAAGVDPIVIPGSRGAMSYLVKPVNSGYQNGYSVAHGAGRKWMRTECRGRLDRKYTKDSISRTALGSRVVCGDTDLLFEEAPEAYKNIESVIDDLKMHGLIEVIAVLRPLVTFKD